MLSKTTGQSRVHLVPVHQIARAWSQACRNEAEQVLQQASNGGLGGGLPLQAWKDLQVCTA